MIVSRILPGNDLKNSLKNIMEDSEYKSGIILCIVGSLKETHLRMSNSDKKVFNGNYEIISSEGTISPDGVHVHIAVSDENGHLLGGHLLEGCIIYTTAEICVLESEINFKRIFDPSTGYKELFVE
jgi:predicted DNA-binding protein with PD1-like motif